MEGRDLTLTHLRRYFLWCASYLALIFVLGQADYLSRPLINFASYFYLLALIGVPGTLFFPHVTRAPAAMPMTIWAGVYVISSLVINRDRTTTSSDFSVIALEFLLLELGILLAYRLAEQISHAESVMDELAVGAFPNRAQELDAGSQHVKTEFNRSRRYHRPLSLLLMEVEPQSQNDNGEVLKAIQYDIVNRFTVARVGQIIDDCLRQSDMVFRDHRSYYVILCPETDLTAALLLAPRITKTVREKASINLQWGAAAFPEEALTFDDLLTKARQRLTQREFHDEFRAAENTEKEISKV